MHHPKTAKYAPNITACDASHPENHLGVISHQRLQRLVAKSSTSSFANRIAVARRRVHPQGVMLDAVMGLQ